LLQLPAVIPAIEVSTRSDILQPCGLSAPPPCAEYHRRKIETDPVYAEVVNDSRKKWRDSHPDYQRAYRQSHEAAAERNRQLQRQRDGKRRLQSLVKNSLALDLKRSPAEVWLVGPAAGLLDRNNLVSSQLFILQPLAPPAAPLTTS
jgi:hypothetical protein